jgi:Tfp pilus assembly PilM family ATPase
MLAIIETLEFNNYLQDDISHLIVDLGEKGTSIGYVSGKVLSEVHVLPLGIYHLLQNIRQASGCSYLGAEAVLRSSDEDKHGSDNVIEEGWAELIKQIENSAHYFSESALSRPLKKVYLTGGGSQYPRIQQLMAEQLGLSVEVVDPFRLVDVLDNQVAAEIATQRAAPLMTVAMGLALRGVLRG